MQQHRSILADGQSLKRDLTAYARSLGFDRVGITSAEPFKREEAFLESWIRDGRAGEMDYLERKPALRARPADLLPGARSVIALAVSYFNNKECIGGSEYGGIGVTPILRPAYRTGRHSDIPIRSPREGRIARYAWGKDYHKVIRKRLEALVRYIEALAPGEQCRTFVDTGPLLERAVAQRAGLGFVGKNTMLITKGLGSYVFLASVITTLELPQDKPDPRSCGACRLCIDACPTQAIMAPHELDARRCIAYLTIESDKAVDPELLEKTGDWLFGCDICQDVCPHNSRASQKPMTGPEIDLAEILTFRTETAFQARFGGTPLARAERHGLLRNACLVAANTGRIDLLPLIQNLAENDPHPVVRETAQWAISQLLILSK